MAQPIHVDKRPGRVAKKGASPFGAASRPASAVEACARRLREAVVGGEIAPGSLLPPERTLAIDLGVNRTTLRAAIQRLAEVGLLEAQQGRGTIVRDFRQHAGLEVLSTVVDQLPEDAGALATAWNEAALARDLLHVRRCLARGVLEAIVDVRPDQAAVGRVKAALARFEAIVAKRADVDALAAADLGVIGAIVDATDRPGLRLCMNPVLRTLSALPKLRAALYTEPAENVAAFRALLPFLETPSPALIEPFLQAMAARDADTLARLS